MIKQFIFNKLIAPLFRQEIYLSERALIERTIDRYDRLVNNKVLDEYRNITYVEFPKGGLRMPAVHGKSVPWKFSKLHDIGNYPKKRRK